MTADALQRWLRSQLREDGWTVDVSVADEPGLFYAAIRHPLGANKDRVIDESEPDWRNVIEESLGEWEFEVVRKAPRTMPHMELVGLLRSVAPVHCWTVEELADVAALLAVNSVLTPDEASWLSMAGPAGHREPWYLLQSRSQRQAVLAESFSHVGHEAVSRRITSELSNVPEHATPAQVPALVGAILENALVPTGWNVTSRGGPPDETVVTLRHDLSEPGGRDVVFDGASWRTQVSRLLESGEVRVISDRPVMSHTDLVSGIRRLAAQHPWRRTDVSGLVNVLSEQRVIEPAEAAWLTWAGPPWTKEPAYAHSWRELLHDCDGPDT